MSRKPWRLNVEVERLVDIIVMVNVIIMEILSCLHHTMQVMFQKDSNTHSTHDPSDLHIHESLD